MSVRLPSFLLLPPLMIWCGACDSRPAPPPARPIEIPEPEFVDRITVHIVPAEGEVPARAGAATRPGDWVVRTSGRAFAADDAGLANLEAVLAAFADLHRRPDPPRVSESAIVIRADPAAPDAITRRVLELCGRTGFYRFEVRGSPLRPESK